MKQLLTIAVLLPALYVGIPAIADDTVTASPEPGIETAKTDDTATVPTDTPTKPDDGKTKPERFWFSGGMGVHVGYANASNSHGPINGVLKGIGGRAHFERLPYFRFGIGGNVSDVSYSSPGLKGSYLRVGYGGLILEACYRYKFFKISAGGLIGGGGVQNLHIIADNGDGTQKTDYRDYATWIFIPTVNFEFFVTKHLALVVTADYMMGTSIGSGFQLGPRFYVGILFYK